MKLRFVLFLTILAASAHAAQPAQAWVPTWTTAQPLFRVDPPAGRGGAAPGRAMSPAQQIARQGFHDQTVRMILRTSIGGSKVRVRLSNAIGAAPVDIGAAHIAVHGKDSEIVAGSDRTLTFGGKPGWTMRPGVVIVSDPVDLDVPKGGELAVSLYFPGETGPVTSHNDLHTEYISSQTGDTTGAPAMADPIKAGTAFWLSAVEVLAPANTPVIVALGDSITEGFRSTPDTNHTWPNLLSARLLANKATANIAMANVGIGGNRILRDGTGASVLARLDRDVLTQPGVKWIILLEGINDIGHGFQVPAEAVTADELIAADKQVIERAHTVGVKVIGATLPPYEGANYASEAGEAVRAALNNWIRTSGAFDGVADFDKATQDPANPKRLRADCDSGDHLHPNDTGYQVMADAVDLGIFRAKK